MDQDKPQKVPMRVTRVVLNPAEPPRGAHWVGFSRVGGEVVMDVGFFDMPKLVNLLKELSKSSAPTAELEVEVSVFARYAMAADSFLRLRQSVNEI